MSVCEGNVLLSQPLRKNLILFARAELLTTQPPLLDEALSFSPKRPCSPLRYARAPLSPLAHRNNSSASSESFLVAFCCFQLSVQFLFPPPPKKPQQPRNKSFTCLNIEVWEEAGDSLRRDLTALVQVTAAVMETHMGTRVV